MTLVAICKSVLCLKRNRKAMGLNVVAEFISTFALCMGSPGSVTSLESAMLTCPCRHMLGRCLTADHFHLLLSS
jgi:hypothetical protein